MAEKFYVTTPIYYVNARPHIGHAYTTIVADVLARRHRLLGDDTFFLTGTDEHGQKIERSAAAAGIPPQQFADQVSKSFEDLWKRMGITNDAYIRTTDEKHKRGVQKLFSELYERGFIYLASYTGQYCVSDEAFVDVSPGEPCPDCGRITETLTEENFFFKLSDFQLPLLDLIESNTLLITPESRRNEVLSFLRGNVAEVLTNAAIENNAVILSEGRSPESKDPEGAGLATTVHTISTNKLGNPYVPGALKDLSISRSSFTWGVPVPEPAASKAAQKHVIYVWLDALANYMTAIGYGSDDPAEKIKFEKFWPADLHLVGKEIIRFHCVYWPAFLLAAGLPLPKAITAHGWLLFDNSKMSKSKGNIVRTETILEGFGTLCPPKPLVPAADGVLLSEAQSAQKDAVILSEADGGSSPAAQSKDPEGADPATTAGTLSTENPTKPERDLFASDVLRYFLLREIPFGQDGSFSFDAMITRYNADLANGYGNLVSRTLNLIDQNFEGNVPYAGLDSKAAEPRTDKSVSVSRLVEDLIRFFSTEETGLLFQIAQEYSRNNFSELLFGIASGIATIDLFLASTKPWVMAKNRDLGDLPYVLYSAAEGVRIITALLYPILPYATARVWSQLGLGDIEQAAADGELNNLEWGGLKPGTKLGPLGPIFPRADKGLAQIMTDMENPAPAEAAPEPTATTDPAAGPRTASLDEPIGTLPVAGSTAHTAGPASTPSHTEATPSAPFDTAASQTPISTEPDTKSPTGVGPESPQITIDDFAKIELRVAQILVAERIPKADKLLRLEVDLGYEKRQILSGIAEWYAPQDLVGRRIVVITNLAPRKMRGLESHGMLLAASNGEDGKPVLATFNEEIALGSRLK